MVLDFPGVMTEFEKVEPGEFFIFFDEGRPAFAMKIYDASVEQDSSQKKAGVLSFSLAMQSSMTRPTVLDVKRFRNRDVCVVSEVVIRPQFEISKLRDGSPPEQSPGPIMFASDGVFVRAWPDHGQKTIDVDLCTGGAGASFAHPGGLWVEDWEIVLIGRSGETVLCKRGTPRGAA